MKYKILEHWPNADGWEVGDVVDISHPEKLLEEGKIKKADKAAPKKVETIVEKPVKKKVVKKKK